MRMTGFTWIMGNSEIWIRPWTIYELLKGLRDMKTDLLKSKLEEAGLFCGGPHDAEAMKKIRELAAECDLFVSFAIHGPRGNPDESGYLRSVGEFPHHGMKACSSVWGEEHPSLVDYYRAQYEGVKP